MSFAPQKRDRELQGSRFFSSRSARVPLVPAFGNIAMDDNDFQICLDRRHARDVLQFAFEKSLSPEFRLQTVRVEQPQPNLKRDQFYIPLTKQYIGYEAVLDSCVIINLYRPHVYAENVVCIQNGNGRSHSNVANGNNAVNWRFEKPSISCLSSPPNANSWRPNCPSDPGVDGSDFVVIHNTHQRYCSLQGVAVEADGPVAIRVDLESRPASCNNSVPPKWAPVAEGAVLRPCRSSPIYFSNGQVRSAQIFEFSREYSCCYLHAARITFVECDGGPVRVGLLVMHGFDMANSMAVLGTHGFDMTNSMAIEDKRTETFEEPGDRVFITGHPSTYTMYAHTYSLTHTRTHPVH